MIATTPATQNAVQRLRQALAELSLVSDGSTTKYGSIRSKHTPAGSSIPRGLTDHDDRNFASTWAEWEADEQTHGVKEVNDLASEAEGVVSAYKKGARLKGLEWGSPLWKRRIADDPRAASAVASDYGLDTKQVYRIREKAGKRNAD